MKATVQKGSQNNCHHSCCQIT